MKTVAHYASAALRVRIRKLFENPKASGRRVVIVAYIGDDYEAFLPNQRGIEIVCSHPFDVFGTQRLSWLLLEVKRRRLRRVGLDPVRTENLIRV